MASKKKKKNKAANAAAVGSIDIAAHETPIDNGNQENTDSRSEDFTLSVAKLADATGIIEIPADVIDSKPSKKEKQNKRQKKFAIGELDDQVKEMLDDALDESAEELGVADDQPDSTSGLSFAQVLTSIFGVFILAFAIVGIVFTVQSVKSYMDAKNDNTKLIEAFERLVIPLAASDTPTFDDVSSLNRDVLLTTACWDVILSPSVTYTVENGFYTISYLELDARIAMLFGKGLQYAHGTVGDEELMFVYNEETGMYKIPCAPRSIAYYPKVEITEQTDIGYILSVSYRTPVAKWISGTTTPEKIMICNVKKSDIGYTIASFEVGEIINQQDL